MRLTGIRCLRSPARSPITSAASACRGPVSAASRPLCLWSWTIETAPAPSHSPISATPVPL